MYSWRYLSSDRRQRDIELLSEAVAALDGNPLRLSSPTQTRGTNNNIPLTGREIERLGKLSVKELRRAAKATAMAEKQGVEVGTMHEQEGRSITARVLRELADNFKTGAGHLPKDESRAAELWQIGEEVFDDPNASFSLAVAQFTGEGTADRLVEVEEKGVKVQQIAVKDRKRKETAQMRLEALAEERGHAPSQYALAKILTAELETTATEHRDRRHGDKSAAAKRALDLYMQAARGGVVPALNNAAVMLAAGDGCEEGAPNERLARKYFEAAAEMGDPRAMLTLASWCRLGRGVGLVSDHNDKNHGKEASLTGQEDEESAFRWHHEAAKYGLAPAQYATAHHFLTGSGVAQDHEKALEWFQLAAERGLAEAAVNLAEMYRLGLGTPRKLPRPEEARHWLRRAEALGNRFASDLLEEGGALADEAAPHTNDAPPARSPNGPKK